jgi:periplasmic copper chaperone A
MSDIGTIMKTFAFILAAALCAPLAQSHVMVEPAAGPAGAHQKLTFGVGHGCQGSATNTLTVQLPDGVSGAKPMPKAGWTVSTADVPGKAGAVREVTWKGGPLPDSQYDEFSIHVKLPDAPGKVAFKVTQLCDKGRIDWIDVPAEGAQTKTPAAVFEVMPGDSHAHQH